MLDFDVLANIELQRKIDGLADAGLQQEFDGLVNVVLRPEYGGLVYDRHGPSTAASRSSSCKGVSTAS